jgi:hypothetical protein
MNTVKIELVWSITPYASDLDTHGSYLTPDKH